jgi:enediyne biosynthesis protein E4
MKKLFFIFFVIFLSNFCGCYKLFAQQFTALKPQQTGVDFVNYLVETKDINFFTFEYLYNGGGVAIGDINNDKLPDIYFTGNLVPNKLYLNKGNLQFEDVTKAAGVDGGLGYKTGVTMADINNDGWLDIYVCKSIFSVAAYRANLLYINNQNGTFTESAAEYGLADSSYSTHAYFYDMDRDGDLDMFSLNYPSTRSETQNVATTTDKNGNQIPVKPEIKKYETDRYFENINGKFIDKTTEAGIADNSFGLSAIIADFNKDLYPDIYVCNDFAMPDKLFINNKNGTYTNQLDKYFSHTTFNSMGSDYADINNDGLQDLMVMDMLPEDNYRQKLLRHNQSYDTYEKMQKFGYGTQVVRNVLQLQNKAGSIYSDVAHLAGMAYTDWSWAPLIADFDNDGLKDVFITNGYLRDVTNVDYIKFEADSILKALQKAGSNMQAKEVLNKIPSTKISNYYFKNYGDLQFQNKTNVSGLGNPTFSSGAAYADLDLDGDLDIVVNNLNEAASVFQNTVIEKNEAVNYIRFALQNTKAMHAYGTTIKVITSNGKAQWQTFMPNKGYISTHEPVVHFGIGNQAQCDSVIITWQDGTKQVLSNLIANTTHTIVQKGIKSIPQNSEKVLFKDITQQVGLKYFSKQNKFSDYKLEPLLPKRYSQLGPCLTVADFNGDGLEDFYIGGASTYAAKIFLQTKQGKFVEQKNAAFEADKIYEDAGVEHFDLEGDGDEDLLVISGGNDFGKQMDKYPARLYINNGKAIFTKAGTNVFPILNISGKAIAIADYNKDGVQDIFIGGRISPGNYGLEPNSYFLRVKNGMVLSDTIIATGMVTDAIWVDINADTWLDLVVVGEWMPVQIFINNNGVLNFKPTEIKYSNGWWNSVKATDVNKDGLTDLVLGNLGTNSRYKASPTAPLTMMVADIDKNGSTDCVISFSEKGKRYPVATRDNLLEQMPFLRKKYIRNQDFAKATTEDIFTKDQIENAKILSAFTMESAVAIQSLDKTFTLNPLPTEAQTFPINSILDIDANKDGLLDLVLAGNDYSAELETGLCDAGIGCYLQGGPYNFKIPNNSGLFISGDVRGIKKITIKEMPCFLAYKNDEALQCILMSQP